MKKRFINLLISSIMLSCCFAFNVSANNEILENTVYELFIYDSDLPDDTDDSLRYTLISQLGIGLVISNQTAYIDTECQTYSNATISMVTELQRYNGSWTTIKTYNSSKSNTKELYFSETYGVTRNYQYRIKLTATVTVGSSSESDTRYGTEQTANSFPEIGYYLDN